MTIPGVAPSPAPWVLRGGTTAPNLYARVGCPRRLVPCTLSASSHVVRLAHGDLNEVQPVGRRSHTPAQGPTCTYAPTPESEGVPNEWHARSQSSPRQRLPRCGHGLRATLCFDNAERSRDTVLLSTHCATATASPARTRDPRTRKPARPHSYRVPTNLRYKRLEEVLVPNSLY